MSGQAHRASLGLPVTHSHHYSTLTHKQRKILIATTHPEAHDVALRDAALGQRVAAAQHLLGHLLLTNASDLLNMRVRTGVHGYVPGVEVGW